MSLEPIPAPNAPYRALRPPLFYLLVGIIFLADQASKSWAVKTLAWDEPRAVVGNAFLLTLTRNTGGAWGLLPRGNTLFIVFASGAVLALLLAYHRMPRVDLLVGAAFALALGGAFGNLTDRLRYGYVVDFFDARLIHWPIFNVADSAISLAIVLLMIHFFRSGKQQAEAERATQRQPSEPQI